MLRQWTHRCLAVVQVAAVCGLRLDAGIPCRRTASPFQAWALSPPIEGEPLFLGRFEPPAKYADRPGERSPNHIKVGCDATEPHGHMCQFFAGTFMRAVFPSSDIEIIPGPSNRSHEADIAFPNVMSTADSLCMPARRRDEIRSPSNHSPGWSSEGVYWPPNGNVSLHQAKRPFCVCQEYEPARESFVDERCDVFITHFSNLRFESSEFQCPVVHMPESFRDFGLRWLSSPQDLTFDRDEDDAALQPLSTVCQTSRLNKSRFMAFMHGACWKDHYPTADFWLRVALFDEVAEGYAKAPEALGYCRGRKDQPLEAQNIVTQKLTEYGVSHQFAATFADEAVLAWEPFKFAVVFQNTHEPGAVQEKIVHAWLARAVPVYFGPSDALTDYNPDSFIDCGFDHLDSKLDQIWALQQKMEDKLAVPGDPGVREYEEESSEFKQIVKFTRELFSSDFQQCLKKIRAVDQDEKAWARMVHTPVFNKGKSIKDSVFDVEVYARRFREVLLSASSSVIPSDSE